MYKGLVLEKEPAFTASVRALEQKDLPAGDVVIDVAYSSLNYKDGLAITNRSPVVRNWPMTAGIDGAGTVLESTHRRWRRGDAVLVNGFGLGETHPGCLAQRARLRGDWLIRRPEKFSARDAMAIGTAGYTASLCVLALERHGLDRDGGDILVTGATGGVGSIAVALLARMGYRVVASTGRPEEIPFLKSLGAADIVDRTEIGAQGRPLQKERWQAVVDVVGGNTLMNACAQTRYGGAVTSCGLAQSSEFAATVMPFILRAVTLIGIDSVMASLALRSRAWELLSRELDPATLNQITTEVELDGAIAAADALMAGKTRGRIVVRTSG